MKIVELTDEEAYLIKKALHSHRHQCGGRIADCEMHLRDSSKEEVKYLKEEVKLTEDLLLMKFIHMEGI